MTVFLIIHAPPRDMEFPEDYASDPTQGETPEPSRMGPHRCVLAAVWAPPPERGLHKGALN